MFYKKMILSSVLTLSTITGLNVLSQTSHATEPSLQEALATYAKPFKDVQKNSSYYTVIHEMRDMGIINGYSDGTFKPNDPINRQNGAAMITRYTPVKYGGTATVPALTDVTIKNGNYNALVAFQKTGIYSVAQDGKVYPTRAMTRGEMAKAITFAFGLKVDNKATTKLKDVPSALIPYVAAIEQTGITTGYEDNTFRPDQTLTRAHFAVFMHRAITMIGKPVQEKSTTDTDATKSPVAEKPVKEKPSKGDYTKPTAYVGDFEYTSDGRVKFEDKKLEDYPLYAYPDHKNDKMYLEGKTREEYNAMNNKILVDRKGEINVTGNGKYPLYYVDGKLNETTTYVLMGGLARYSMSEGEVYRMLTYLYYTGDVYKTNNLTAYIVYAVDNGMPSVVISYGKR